MQEKEKDLHYLKAEVSEGEKKEKVEKDAKKDNLGKDEGFLFYFIFFLECEERTRRKQGQRKDKRQRKNKLRKTEKLQRRQRRIEVEKVSSR